LGTPALLGDGAAFDVGATVVVAGGAVVVVVGLALLLLLVVVAGGAVVELVVVLVAVGFVRPVHCVDDAAFVAEAATTAGGTLTVVVVVAAGLAGLPVSGLRRASGCSAIVLPAGASVAVSSVSSAVVSLTLVRCGTPTDGPAAGSSCPMSRVVSAVRPANAAMGAITTAAKHPRPLAGSSR
jgi:hypothetical protein